MHLTAAALSKAIMKGEVMSYESLKAKKRTVILDTDIGPDCDDVGALAVLFSYAKELDVPVLGVCNCTSNRYGSATVDVIREYCKYPEIPIGGYDKPGFYDSVEPSHTQHYNKYIAETYSKRFQNGTLAVLPHVSFYRNLLAKAEDDSVVLITIGMFNCLADFLRSGGDEYSPLTGMELAEKKIHCMVSMAAIYPEGREFNVICDPRSARYVFEHFPKPMYLSDFRVGETVFNGYDVKKRAAGRENDPIYDSYRLYTAAWARPGFNRSFDLTAVQFAFEGEGEIYSLTSPGRLEFYNADPERFPTDATRFVEDEQGRIRFLIKELPDEEIAVRLQKRMDER